LSPQERERFYKHEEIKFLPEVGSRALGKLLIDMNNNVYSYWQIVQPDTYQYMVIPNPLSVRMVIWNYLAVEVIW
jgi:hypothetical protein